MNLSKLIFSFQFFLVVIDHGNCRKFKSADAKTKLIIANKIQYLFITLVLLIFLFAHHYLIFHTKHSKWEKLFRLFLCEKFVLVLTKEISCERVNVDTEKLFALLLNTIRQKKVVREGRKIINKMWRKSKLRHLLRLESHASTNNLVFKEEFLLNFHSQEEEKLITSSWAEPIKARWW